MQGALSDEKRGCGPAALPWGPEEMERVISGGRYMSFICQYIDSSLLLLMTIFLSHCLTWCPQCLEPEAIAPIL